MTAPNNNTPELWDAEYAKGLPWRAWPYGFALAAIPGDFFPASILDVGCGVGVGLAAYRARWPGADLAGVDFSEVGLARAAEAVPGAALAQINLNGPLPTCYANSADLVTCCQTLEHVDDPSGVEEWLAALALRLVVVTVPDRGRRSAHHPQSFDPDWFVRRGYVVQARPHPVPKDGLILVAILEKEIRRCRN